MTTQDMYGNFSWNSVSCGTSAEGSLNYEDVVFVNFTNDYTQDVFFTTCNSTFDTVTDLYMEDGTWVSNGSCNLEGDDCNYKNWCGTPNRETFLMEDLEAGDYILVLHAEHMSGEYAVEVFCQSDSDWNETVLDMFQSTTDWPTWTTTPSPTFEAFTTDVWWWTTDDDNYTWNTTSTTMDPWDDKDYVFFNSTLYCNANYSTVYGDLDNQYNMVFNVQTYWQQDIFFTNCGSSFDTRMRLLNANGSDWHYWAANGGCSSDDDCDNYCY